MKSKNMHGFLCRSDVSTAVCLPNTTRSVVVPRRSDRTLVDRAMLVDFNSYSHLLESRRLGSATNAGSGEKNRMVIATKRDRTTATIKPKTTTSKKPITSIPSSLTSTYGDAFQVVVMRVSIHCQGCAGKVKKHISKMEGVTSFSIDLETKKVTVMGHISPVGVLESISKVKKAEFWHS